VAGILIHEGTTVTVIGHVLDGAGGCCILCGVEGCPRRTLEGQEAGCGLASMGVDKPLDHPIWSRCGSVRTLDHWFAPDGSSLPCEERDGG